MIAFERVDGPSSCFSYGGWAFCLCVRSVQTLREELALL